LQTIVFTQFVVLQTATCNTYCRHLGNDIYFTTGPLWHQNRTEPCTCTTHGNTVHCWLFVFGSL